MTQIDTTSQQLALECSAEEWQARVDLALAYRAVDAMGWQRSVIYNHISSRVPGTESHFLINPFGLMYSEITASNLLKVDIDGNKLVPSPHPLLMAGFVVHRSIHMSRPDAHCVIHTHSLDGVAVACQEDGLLPLNLTSMILQGRVAYYDVEGVTNDASESDRIAAALGDKNLMILRNHGLLTCGSNMAEAFQRMRRLEESCSTQIAAQSGGARLRIPPAEVQQKTATEAPTMAADGSEVGDGSYLLWAAIRRWMERLDPSFLT